MSLSRSAIRIEGLTFPNGETAEALTELQLVFRLSRDESGQWQVKEVRAGEARWEDVQMMAAAANVDLPHSRCGVEDEPGSLKPQPSDLKVKVARCLVANLFAVPLSSDAVRINEVSGLGLGSQPSAIAETLVRTDFRFVKDSHGWRVSDFRSGNRSWVGLENIATAMDAMKRSKTREDLNSIATALKAFHQARGSYVVSEKQSVLIDHLAPHYLNNVIRLDSWSRPLRYQGTSDHFTLRSLGPDGKENTPDDIVVSSTGQ